MTLSRLVADYLLYRRALGRRLIRDGVLLHSFCRSVGKLPLGHIPPDSVRAFLLKGAVSQETIARRHRALAGFYRYVQGRQVRPPALSPTSIPTTNSNVFCRRQRQHVRTLWH
jgi:hypothetical protein